MGEPAAKIQPVHERQGKDDNKHPGSQTLVTGVLKENETLYAELRGRHADLTQKLASGGYL